MRNKNKSFVFFLIVGLLFIYAISASAVEKWKGVDESVVEKFAQEHGRKAHEPLINLSGDVLLFAFLGAGVVGGFAAGYYWRKLNEPTDKPGAHAKDRS